MNMKIQDLESLLMNVSDVRAKIAEIIENRQTKVIVKNNVPKSVIMPYDEYVELMNKIEQLESE